MLQQSPLEINGTTYTLEFDFNLLARAEQESGVNLMLGISHMNLASIGQLRGLLLGLLLKNHPKMTLETAGALFTTETLPKIAGAIAPLFPEADEPEPPVENPAQEPQEVSVN